MPRLIGGRIYLICAALILRGERLHLALRLELYDSMARDRLPSVDENSTLSPACARSLRSRRSRRSGLLDFLSAACPAVEAPVEF